MVNNTRTWKNIYLYIIRNKILFIIIFIFFNTNTGIDRQTFRIYQGQIDDVLTIMKGFLSK